jgi:hypothetical protein
MFTLLYPLHLPSPPTAADLFYIPVLHCFSVCLLFSGALPWNFTWNILYFNQSNPLYYSSLPFPLPCIVQHFSMSFVASCSYTDVMYFNIFHSLSLFSSFSPPLVSSNSPTFGNMFRIYIYMYIYIYTHTHIYIHIYMHIYDNACICIWICLPHMRENT